MDHITAGSYGRGSVQMVCRLMGLLRYVRKPNAIFGQWLTDVGFQTPPMHGDYEAQRHWMEITTQLPISQWYFYDLEYWGLDYPPLTAYHSWLFGQIGSLINPAWFALTTSRGIEEQLLKVYMRASVIVSEYLVYMPAAIILTRKFSHLRSVNKWEGSIALIAILMQPGTILIDHAHFQYNTVMLGFILASIAAIMSERYFWASAFFVGALCFKQMALYYAPAMFAYLLGVCLLPEFRFLRFLGIAFATILSFAVVFAPMLIGALYDNYRNINPPLSISDRQINPLFALLTPYIDTGALYYPVILQLTQIIHRIFPFARGIFEDKVANMWCVLHTIHKLHLYPIPLLQRISLSATIVAVLPACMTISLHPRRELVPWAMASCAWGFFLCSFQVHEKSVLLPLLPMTVLLGGNGGLGVEMRAWIGWANMLGVWTMFPLLKRDELRVPYFILTGLWAFLMGLPPISLDLYSRSSKNGLNFSTKMLHLTFYATMIFWHFLDAFMEPPKGKPDLWVVLNIMIGAAGFGICYLWCTWQLILRSGIMDPYLSYRQDQEGKSKEKKAKALPLTWSSVLGTKPDLAKPEQKAREGSPKKAGRPSKARLPKPDDSAVSSAREGSPRKAGRPRKNPEK